VFPLPFRLERTKNRTSRATIVDDIIVIRLAGHLPKSEEQRHIDSLLKRMTKVQVALRDAPLIDPFRPLLRGETEASVTFGDGSVRQFVVTAGTRTRAQFEENRWIIRRASSCSEPAFHRFLWRLLAISEQSRIAAQVKTINDATFRERIGRIRLRFMRARWGSCARSGTINLNTALLFVSPALLHYVILHELAHRGYPNHSKAFWGSLARFLPDHCTLKKSLKYHRLPHVL
jgi:hypothetical protein